MAALPPAVLHRVHPNGGGLRGFAGGGEAEDQDIPREASHPRHRQETTGWNEGTVAFNETLALL